MQKKIYLGNLDAQRDWGHAKDYIKGMWMMLQQDKADDFVLATGVTNTVRKFVELAFGETGISLKWEGTGENEKGINIATNEVIIEVDPKYYRPTEVELLIGDPSKAHKELGWKHEYDLEALVKEMVASDLEQCKKDLHLKAGGFTTLNYFE